jgi:hypothetical protein
MSNGSQTPVFDTEKCLIPFVQRIPDLQIIQNCDVPQAPGPIADCPDFSISVPSPRPLGPPCPQIQTDRKNSGFMEDIPTFPPPDILLTFQLDEPPPDEPDEQKEDDPCKFQVQVQMPCASFVDSMTDCQISDICLIVADIVPVLDPGPGPINPRLKQRCQYQLQVQLQLPCPVIKGGMNIQCGSSFPLCEGSVTVENKVIGPTKALQFCQTQIQIDLTLQSPSKTAIMPAGNEFVGLFCHEMPESWFSDVMTTRIVGAQAEVPIDPTFLQVVEPGSVKVLSVVPEKPVLTGAQVIRDQVVVRKENRIGVPERPGAVPDLTNVVMVVAGIRRGTRGQRFTRFTEEQKRSNDQFWSRAHKPQE